MAKYDFDSDALRRFFRVDDVISGMFALTQDLYGVTFEELPTFYTEDENVAVPEGKTSIWHPEVKYYAIYEEDKSLLGHFYTDWHPRDSKRSGAWQNTVLDGGLSS